MCGLPFTWHECLQFLDLDGVGGVLSKEEMEEDYDDNEDLGDIDCSGDDNENIVDVQNYEVELNDFKCALFDLCSKIW